MVRICTLGVAVAAMVACQEQAVLCTDDIQHSIEATVAGSGGETLTGVSVSYQVGGIAETDCVFLASSGDTDDAGPLWMCGSEEVGDFTVTAIADGHGPETVEVAVEEDECRHPIREAVAFELDWLPD